jgi:hypothetical protein
LPRAYIANCINTLVQGDAFRLWVKARVDERHSKMIMDRGTIEMDAEIAEIYFQSKAVSGKYIDSILESLITQLIFSIAYSRQRK